MAGVAVAANDQNFESSTTSVTDSQGAFTLRVAHAGNYHLQCNSPEHRVGSQPVTADTRPA